MSNKRSKVLFICIGNMCRSPMAEGFGRVLGGKDLDVYSAGTHPTGVVSEDAIMIMEEKGIDISHQRSNGIDAVPLDEIDVAVSMASYPIDTILPADFTGKKIEWDVDDPIGRSLEVFRNVRDDIEQRVKNLIEEIRQSNLSSKP